MKWLLALMLVMGGVYAEPLIVRIGPSKFKNAKEWKAARSAFHPKVLKELGIIGAVVIDGNPADYPGAEPDTLVYADTLESVGRIGAVDAWNLGIEGQGTRVGIVDTGVDWTHPDLGGCFGPGCKVAGGWDFVNDDPVPMDDHRHGTHVAGTVAGNGPVFRGVAPAATIYALKVLSAAGSGYSSDIIAAMEWAADPNGDGDTSDHLDAINMSLGSSCSSLNDSKQRAVAETASAGVVVVASAGNNGGPWFRMGSPGCSKDGIGVAANSKAGTMASFSSRGPMFEGETNWFKPDVTAPGVSICAAKASVSQSTADCYDTIHTSMQGTSMSAPHVTGLAALIKQVHPEYGSEEVKRAIKANANSLGFSTREEGTGEINALASVLLGDPGPPTEYINPSFKWLGTTTGTAHWDVPVETNTSIALSGFPAVLSNGLLSIDTSDSTPNGFHSTVLSTSNPLVYSEVVFLKDASPPTASFTSPMQQTSPVDLYYSVTDDQCLSELVIVRPYVPDPSRLMTYVYRYAYGLTQDPPYAGFCTKNASSGQVNIELPNGTYPISIESRDVAGNITHVDYTLVVGTSPTPTPSPTPSPTPTPTPTPPPPGDMEPPEVTFDPPVSVQRRSTITLEGSATDNVGVTRLRLFIDYQMVLAVDDDIISYSWNVGPSPSKVYGVELRAYDEAGNMSSKKVYISAYK